MTTAQEQLIRRLERMAVPPAPRDLAARAVAAAREPERPRRRTGLVLAVAALVLAGGAMAATWPAPLRAVPSLAWFANQAIAGLGATQAPPVRQDSATAGGYTLRVTSAYDDGNRVILVLRVDRADGRPAGQAAYAYTAGPNDRDGQAAIGRYPTLTDAAGQTLLPTLSLGGGSEIDLFYSRPAHGPGAGTPLTLTADRVLVDGGGAVSEAVTGQWTLHVQARPSKAPQDLAVPPAGSAGPVRVTVTAVRISDAYLDVRFDATGPRDQVDFLSPTLIAPDGTMAALIDQGRPEPQKGAAPDSTAGTNHDDFAWQLAGAGTYRLVFRTPDGQALVRTIVVPHGRAQRVPSIQRAPCCG